MNPDQAGEPAVWSRSNNIGYVPKNISRFMRYLTIKLSKSFGRPEEMPISNRAVEPAARDYIVAAPTLDDFKIQCKP